MGSYIARETYWVVLWVVILYCQKPGTSKQMKNLCLSFTQVEISSWVFELAVKSEKKLQISPGGI